MKKWYTSKTLWVNVLAMSALLLQELTGQEILSTEAQVALLGLLNVGLRLITKKPIEW